MLVWSRWGPIDAGSFGKTIERFTFKDDGTYCLDRHNMILSRRRGAALICVAEPTMWSTRRLSAPKETRKRKVLINLLVQLMLIHSLQKLQSCRSHSFQWAIRRLCFHTRRFGGCDSQNHRDHQATKIRQMQLRIFNLAVVTWHKEIVSNFYSFLGPKIVFVLL